MTKALLFVLAAIVNFVVAFFMYRGDSVIKPLILCIAGLCFIIAAVGAARGAGGSRT